MKLFSKYNRINIVATIFIFLAASVAFFFTLKFVLFNQIDEDLRIEQREITAYVKQFNRLPENMQLKDQIITYNPISSPVSKRQIKTVLKKDLVENDVEKFREFKFDISVAGQWYQISVSKSLEDMNNLIRLIAAVTMITILTMLIASFVINRIILKRLWQPFNHSLESVRRFRISGNETLDLSQTEIDEFRLMNETLKELTQKAKFEYLSLKTFSENASHEIQTPIAIIQSKLDLLIQDEQLIEAQSKTVQDVYDAVLRLSRLSSSLLLLAKIENNQFADVEQIGLKQKLKEKMNDFHELWQSQRLEVFDHLEESYITMNPYLAEILLNNLLSNATKYNFSGGTIFLSVKQGELIVKNSSQENRLREENMFQRFYKSSGTMGGHGLGLSVVKQVADASGLSVEYGYEGGYHRFTIRWS